jgi:hypothetical protein
VVEDDGPVDQRAVVPGRPLGEPAGAEREVADELRRPQRQAVEVDDVDVGLRARRQRAAIGDAEQLRALMCALPP